MARRVGRQGSHCRHSQQTWGDLLQPVAHIFWQPARAGVVMQDYLEGQQDGLQLSILTVSSHEDKSVLLYASLSVAGSCGMHHSFHLTSMPRAPWVTGGRGQWVCWLSRIGRISPAQCGDGLDALLLLLHALYLLQHQGAPTWSTREEDTPRDFHKWGSTCGSSTIRPWRVNSGWTSCSSSRILAEWEQHPCVLRSHHPGEHGPAQRLQAPTWSPSQVWRSRVSWKTKRLSARTASALRSRLLLTWPLA